MAVEPKQSTARVYRLVLIALFVIAQLAAQC